MVRTTTSRILVLGTVSALVACGGGGSSGGSSDGGGGTPTSPPESVELELDAGGLSEQRALVEGFQDFQEVLDVYSGAEQTYLSIDEIREAALELDDAVGQSGNTVTVRCDNPGSGTLAFTLNRETETDFTLEFRNCQLATAELGTVVLNGTYTYVNLVSETDSSREVDGFQIVDLTGTIVSGSEPIAMQGSDAWETSTPLQAGSGPREETYTTDALEFLRGGDYKAITNAVTTLSSQGGITEVTINSRLIDSATDGYVDISTTTTMKRPTGGGCPDEGVVRIIGEPEASGIEIAYGVSILPPPVMGSGTEARATVIGTSDTEDYTEAECEALIF
ncbi:hypothetical protein [Marinobacter sp. M-5]|uniref:hypothetical protein n=1 Tax=Marinobacter sp. M-5 TaxID=3081089 RepID=UPI00293C76B5|nr:hypothetical protein [Marinobacter sp. M-5]MDV3505405.1 hypothetical protein [Marinobacter sp. M-5]